MEIKRCDGCHNEEVQTHECSFCGESFGVACGCLTRDYKETDLDLCTLCQPKTDRIIAHLVTQVHIAQSDAKVWKEGFYKIKRSITRNSITV
jgi:hypothetical protein